MILYINTISDPRNASATLVDALRGRLSLEGIPSVLAYGRGNSLRPEDIRIQNGVELLSHAFLSRLSGREGEGSRLATYRLLRKMDSMDISLVHLHNLHGHYLNLDLLTSWLRVSGIPVVLTLHDCWTLTPRCATFRHNNCNPSAQFCASCAHKNEYPAAWHFSPGRNLERKQKWFGGLPELNVVGVSTWITEAAKHLFPSRDAHFHTILNGTDRRIWHPGNDVRQNRGILLAAAANWEPSKGLHYLNALQRYLPSEMKIRVIGNTMGQKLHPGIEYAGAGLSPQQMADEYRSASLLLFPAGAESFGMIAAEAIACGLPVLAQDTPASREILSATSGGVLTDFSNPENVAGAARWLLSRGKEHLSMTPLDIEKTADAYLSLYRSLIR